MTAADAELIAAERSRAHRALYRAAPDRLRDAMAAVESVAVIHGLEPRVAADVERVVVHQVAKALGVRT